jgi:hypothetical protein
MGWNEIGQLGDGTYYWRVASIGENGIGEWSPTFRGVW